MSNFNIRFIKLDKNITCEYVCGQVSSLVTSFIKDNGDISEYLLTLDIKPISVTIDPTVPKIPQTVTPNAISSPNVDSQ